MNKIILLILFISILKVHGQKCETFDRTLFHFLPNEFPDTVNCIDSNGQKQGWWLIYKTKYNPADQPDVLEKGNYVERYQYGRYLSNRKIGTWKFVENVHLVYEKRIDSFYYSKDSTVIISEFADGGWNQTKTYYNADSTIIHFEHLLPDESYPYKIGCDKKRPRDKQCIMIYRNAEIKKFPLDRLDIEKELLTLDYFRQRIMNHEKKK